MLDINFIKTNIFNIQNIDAKKILDSLEEDESGSDDNMQQPKKRRKLDDFTPKERMIRRKLKNRVAAQNARDRKKERMESLEKIVTRLENENEELKKSNQELRSNMNTLLAQNQELKKKFGMSFNDKQIFNVSTPAVPDHDHIVKLSKPEGPVSQHALPGVSLQKKLQVLLVSLIMMWLSNPNLATQLMSLSSTQCDITLKTMLQKKLLSKSKLIQKKHAMKFLLRMNLSKVFQVCLKKKQMIYLNSVKTSRNWWRNPTIL